MAAHSSTSESRARIKQAELPIVLRNGAIVSNKISFIARPLQNKVFSSGAKQKTPGANR